MTTLPTRALFEAAVKEAPGQCKYIFLTDNPFYADNLISDEYMSVFIAPEPQDNAYTVEEFHDYVCKYTEAIYASDFIYFAICTRKTNMALQAALDDRGGCKYGRNAWRHFNDKADYFQQHENELSVTAQKVVDDWEGKGKEVKETKPKQSEILYDLVCNTGARCFRDDAGELFAVIPVDKHWEVWRLEGDDFKTWLYKLYRENTSHICGGEAVTEALAILKGHARFDSPDPVNLSIRVSAHENVIWYDLANATWQAINVTPEGWEVSDNPPLLFHRFKHQAAQVTPKQGGDIRKIFKYVNVKEGRTLFLAWLVSCFVPDIPHVMSIFYGEKGSGKTTACGYTKAIIDPSALETMTLQNDLRTLAVNLSQHWFLPFDNVSYINEETSDTLCRAITGGGIQQRKLHTNADDVIFTFKRCLAINGINNVATRPDLLDRAILVELERIKETNRREAAIIQAEFEQDKADILGGIFDTLVKAMGIFPNVKLERLPRMADFTRWGYAISEALGSTGQTFIDEYAVNRESQNDEAIAADPVATLIVEYMKEKEAWSGLMSGLLKELKAFAFDRGYNVNGKGFPSQPHILSKRLRSIKSNLETVGITHVVYPRNEKGVRVFLKRAKLATLDTLATQTAKILDLSHVANNHADTFHVANDTSPVSDKKTDTWKERSNNAVNVANVANVSKTEPFTGVAIPDEDNPFL